MEFGYHYTRILTTSAFVAYLVCRTPDKERWAVASVGTDPIPDSYRPSFNYESRKDAVDFLEAAMAAR